MEKIVTELRITSAAIKNPHLGELTEILEIKASGTWNEAISPLSQNFLQYPVSLHITVYPRCGVIPAMGDKIRVSIERV